RKRAGIVDAATVASVPGIVAASRSGPARPAGVAINSANVDCKPARVVDATASPANAAAADTAVVTMAITWPASTSMVVANRAGVQRESPPVPNAAAVSASAADLREARDGITTTVGADCAGVQRERAPVPNAATAAPGIGHRRR